LVESQRLQKTANRQKITATNLCGSHSEGPCRDGPCLEEVTIVRTGPREDWINGRARRGGLEGGPKKGRAGTGRRFRKKAIQIYKKKDQDQIAAIR